MGRGKRGSEPPAAFRWFLSAVTPREGAAGPSLLGDLHEEFTYLHARRGRTVAAAWYAWQALHIGIPYLVSSGRSVAVAAGRGVALDARHAGRALAATPGATAVAVLSLTLGIGLSVSAAAVVEGIWFAPPPYPEMDRLMDLEDVHPVEVCEGCSAGTSYRSYLEWREEVAAFDQVAAMVAAGYMEKMQAED